MNSIITSMKKNITASICPGIMLGLMLVIGYYVKTTHGCTLTLFRLLIMVFGCVLMTMLVAFIYGLLDHSGMVYADIPFINSKFKKGWLYFIFAFCVIFILWIPSFFALYPGIYAYDASWQYDMYRAGEVTTHHPIIHTYLLGFVIDTVASLTGSINKGIAVYTLVQMGIIGLGCAYILYEFYKRKEPLWMHIFALCWFCLFPPFVIFVMTNTKDSFFAIAVADFILLTLSFKENPDRFLCKTSNIVLWILFAFEVCILRNNAIYVVILSLPFFVIFIVKSDCDKKKAFLMIGITAVLFLIYKYPVTSLVTTEGTSKAEMLSVPCQQIMRVYKYHYDDLTEETKSEVERFFDPDTWYGYYVPEIADATKGSLRMEVFEEDKDSFIALWKSLFSLYPQEYIDSFLENTYGFFYPWPHYVLYSFGAEGYTPVLVMAPGEQNSKIPLLLKFFKLFENSSLVNGNGFISWLFAPATFFYMFILFAFYLIKDSIKKYGASMLFILLLWATFLLGPVAMVRYALYLYALIPIWPSFVRSRNMSKRHLY